MRKPVLAFGAGLVVFAVLVAGCGGGDGKLKAADFADKTCPDLGVWGKSVTDAFGDLQNLGESADPETRRRS